MNDKKSDVKTIFGRALEMESPEERAAYLDETCAGDVELRNPLVRAMHTETTRSGVRGALGG